jgi:hypothetical protein
MIRRVDWLALHSPMKIHWAQQWLPIPYHQKIVQLQGILSPLPVGTIIQLNQLHSVDSPAPETSMEWPPEIQELIQHY